MTRLLVSLAIAHADRLSFISATALRVSSQGTFLFVRQRDRQLCPLRLDGISAKP
jgi:hypothetical protein